MALPIVTGYSELALPPDAHVGAFLAAVRGFFDQAHQDALGVVDQSLSEQRVIVETLGEQNRVLQVQVAQLEAARKEADATHTAVESALKAENEALRQELERMQAERDALRVEVGELKVDAKIVKEIQRILAGLNPRLSFTQSATTAQMESWIHSRSYGVLHSAFPMWVRKMINENKRK